MPKLFRLTKGGKLNASIFEGATINTPSMLAVEDMLAALDWADSIGGGAALIARADANFAALDAWVRATDWIEWLADDPATRSTTSMCLKIVDPAFLALDDAAQAAFYQGSGEPDRGRGRGLRLQRLPLGPGRAAHLGRQHGRDREYRSPAAMAGVVFRPPDRRNHQTKRNSQHEREPKS